MNKRGPKPCILCINHYVTKNCYLGNFRQFIQQYEQTNLLTNVNIVLDILCVKYLYTCPTKSQIYLQSKLHKFDQR